MPGAPLRRGSLLGPGLVFPMAPDAAWWNAIQRRWRPETVSLLSPGC